MQRNATMLGLILLGLLGLAGAAQIQEKQLRSAAHLRLRAHARLASSSHGKGAAMTVLSGSGADDAEDDDDGDEADTKSDKGKAARHEENQARQRATNAARERSRLRRATHKLKDIQRRQEAVKAQLAELQDKRAFKKDVDATVKEVANETQSAAMAQFLGDMRKEMWMLGSPFLIEHLEETLGVLKTEESAQRTKIAAAEAALEEGEQRRAKATGKEKEEDEDEDEDEEDEDEGDEAEPAVSTKSNATAEEDKKDDAEEKGAKRAKTEAVAPPSPVCGLKAGDHKAMFCEATMPKVSPTVQCVLSLTIQFFVVYTTMAILRTVKQFANRGEKILRCFEACCDSMFYAPMLCVLFLGTRMRAIQLSQGQTEKYQLPQPWVQTLMYTCTYAVLAMTILKFLVNFFGVASDNLVDDLRKPGGAAKIAAAIHYTALLALYIGAVGVCVGACLMKAPEEIWGSGGPPVSPAVMCTMILTATFFIVYLGSDICNTLASFGVKGAGKLEGIFKQGTGSVNLAPMLAILFISARMRALQIDPKHGNPQKWAQRCFFSCTAGVVFMTIIALVGPMFGGAILKDDRSKQFKILSYRDPMINLVATIIRYSLLVGIYGGACAVMVSVFLIEAPGGFEETPPISPAVQCVIGLASQYFLTCTAVFICTTILEFTAEYKANTIKNVTMLLDMFEAGMKAVKFAPMLSMLFIAARMRALQLTRTVDDRVPPSAGPQPWAQEGMFLATWSVFVQLLMTILVTLAIGGTFDTEAKDAKPASTNRTVGIVLDVIKYLCLLAMYGGAVAVMYGICTMTPETLPPYVGYKGLIPGVKVPTPPAP